MQEGIQNVQIKYFTSLCKKHRLRVTPQRISIFIELMKSTEHPTADNIYALIQSEHPHISFDTVNRTLNTFSRIGIISTAESYSGAKRFDPQLADHHHIHCIRCGTITDFEDSDYDDLNIKDEINRRYKVINKRVVINVICHKCQD